ncbi:hypothetical protein LRS05_05095 [Flavobacterium sp. J372]|uniref:hypothetical protein n=1 Tax=Flavobacterium sp. J372 TaxID=2898436 RepID=UPI002150B9CB|nr:hypothetical protein [Flavobacterium sp. J372]MCR5861554.1 hypothetical protein [Flavobacterium sp. J372]
MKVIVLYFLLLFTITTSWQENIIAEMAIQQFPDKEGYHVIATPNNHDIKNFVGNKRTRADLELPNITFGFNKMMSEKWNLKTFPKVKDKVTIIADFNTLTKKQLNSKGSTYLELSNPIFSEDGMHALITVNVFTDYVMSELETILIYFKR